MGKYVCSICGYTHDEASGVAWEELDANWVCPLCRADKTAFKKEATEEVVELVAPTLELDEATRALTTLEMSILCSNLAKGCEKQYKSEEAELFTKLAEYFKRTAPKMQADHRALSILVKEDIQNHIILANQIAKANGDRGAQRALVWDEKVTLILQSILNRYEAEGEAMLKDTNVYVCTICGFIYIGNELPELCPVCKVPNWKFDKIEGGQ